MRNMPRMTRTAFASGVIGLLLVALPGTSKAETLDDAKIQAAIDAELLFDYGVGTETLHVDVVDGIVTMTGTVDNVLSHDRAIRIAETVRGVRSIVDRIVTDPPNRSDADVKMDVKDALLINPATSSWEIGVSVHDGIVTLDGTVDSWQEQDLAEKITKGVRGVKEVRSNLKFDYPERRSDNEMREEIEQTLRWDTLVDDGLIDITVKNGDVKLSGTVGSLAEKRVARTDAWVSGVKSVNTDKLDVAIWARDEQLRSDKYVQKSDAAVAEAVEDALIMDPRVLSDDVEVLVDDGVVSLEGVALSVREKQAAAADARNTVGVWNVRNMLTVTSNENVENQELRQRVENALERDPFVEKFEVDVDAENGNILLSGKVDNYYEKARAQDDVADVRGVKTVVNNLTVSYDMKYLSHDDYVDDGWYRDDFGWYTAPSLKTGKTDAEIKEGIESQFFWSPFVDGDDINVTVDDGVATLTGTVETWRERADATENAYEGGATFVENDLQVTYAPSSY